MKFLAPVLTAAALLIGLADPAGATFPGENGRIAFLQGPDVYTMRADGSDVKQLTNLGPDSGADWESWSPDGRQIVFNEYRPPDFLGQIWLMNADGSNQRLLLADNDFSNERPSFTADGMAVIFTRCELPVESETCPLYQIRLDGSGLIALTNRELGVRDYSGKSSPDGASLAFTGVARNGIVCAIYVAQPPYQRPSLLTPPPLSARHPDWSPDGRQIAVSTHFGTPQNEEIWIINAHGGGVRQLTNNGSDYFGGPHDFNPSWSPRGDAIVFARASPDFSSGAILVMNVDGSGFKKLFTLRGTPTATIIHAREAHDIRRSDARRHFEQLADGGAKPQWGTSPD